MTDSFSAQRPSRLWNELRRLVADRAASETEIATTHAEEKRQTESQFQAARKRTAQEHQTERAALEARYVAARKAVVHQCDTEHAALEKEYQRVRNDADARFEETKAKENQKLKEARWEATTVFEATKDAPGGRLKQFEEQMAAGGQGLAALRAQADRLLQRRWQQPGFPEFQASEWPDGADPAGRFGALVQQAHRQWQDLAKQRVARQFEGGTWFLWGPLFWLLAVVPSGYCTGWSNLLWIPVSLVIGLLFWTALLVWLYGIARRQTAEAYTALQQTLLDAELAAQKALTVAKATCEEEEAAIAQRLRNELDGAGERFTAAMEEARARHDAAIGQADEHYPPRLTELIVRRESELDRLEQQHTQQMEEFDERYRQETRQREEQYAQEVEQQERLHQEAFIAMAQRWHMGMDRFEQEVDGLNQTKQQLFFDWDSRDPADWQPVMETPRAVPFGRLSIDLAQLEGGISDDERLGRERSRFVLPALVPFPDRSLLMTAADDGRSRAVETIQAIMLHMLAAARPGKIRFTIVDPVGLGESFSAFMHLADYDEQVIASRIWTESTHIEQQLVNLTEHMENVIQVYLRNEFETIQEYNDFAGEMAEPYRVLVVANFPTNFTESAARRLLSIVSSGARCGVFVLLSVDGRLKLPHGFELADLETQMIELAWQQDRFVWNDPELGTLPLQLDTPPVARPFTELVRAVGEQIHDVDRVEVPFEFVVPKEDDWWKGDTARGLEVALGRAGAMKLQHLNLGRGTAQHVLVAGKTGSGKSNLMHAIITNTALWYAPDQVELYLVDFKKGVEFKPYAQFTLPHARVVAVESEREFGLSVLERLDAELRERGDRFRQLGVQDLAGWRKAKPQQTMPRVLLVIDEFQELFVEDDRIAQNAALLLDRLVRQGRAFGMHVLLGSQTLAGAYSLPRATIGQMAVRIALQCGESDAHLILSEENTAARLLTRPGEAIYNDANGLFEGNHPFQVVWLPDYQKAAYLQRLHGWAESHECHTPPPIVFEGNAAADPSENRLLAGSLAADDWPDFGQPASAWLGAAVAIKDPTVVAFRRQGGSNLLLVGHDDESALGILSTSMISLAAQTPPLGSGAEDMATFFVLDGTRPEAPEAGYWKRFCEFLPQRVRLAGPRQTADLLGQLAAELSRRQDERIDDAPPLYLVVFNLGRFRDLRRKEDSFGLSSLGDEGPPSPADQLTQLLREGPALGIHSLIWCDTCNTLGRWLARQTIHDLEMRVAFQMSEGDSSMLIDSAEAGRLGAHRAILYDEGLGQMEKFRPYGPPDDRWLAQVQDQLGTRAAKAK